MKILVTGATGYIGGRLVPRLLSQGHSLRVLARDPEKVLGRSWGSQVEIHAGDLGDPESLVGLGQGMDLAYYLVHSMESGADFAQRDREAVDHFIQACEGVRHVIQERVRVMGCGRARGSCTRAE
ncbi:MAG: NAD(P)H-binding protein [Gemmatimonadota bacterium]